uniref:ceramidase n=1 Tax=Strigamia maritima TaxID=126957 RepID=T1J1P5_STRMM
MKSLKFVALFLCNLFLLIKVAEQISVDNAQQCAFGSYPPSDGGKIPTYVINLDSAPKDRWTKLVQDKKSEIIELLDNIKNISDAFFHGKLIYLIDTYFPYIAKTLPYPYSDEIKGISDATGIPLGEITLYNIFYELFSVCTSIVAQDKNGQIYHGRNFDFGLFLGWDTKNKTWTSTEILRRMVVNVDYQKNGKTAYQSMQLSGYVGVFTGMKPVEFDFIIYLKEKRKKERKKELIFSIFFLLEFIQFNC